VVDGGVILRDTLPTLRHQIHRSVWGQRGWTYQETVMSLRCLYFTDDQVYFACNLIQNCESIDESEPPLHSFSFS